MSSKVSQRLYYKVEKYAIDVVIPGRITRLKKLMNRPYTIPPIFVDTYMLGMTLSGGVHLTWSPNICKQSQLSPGSSDIKMLNEVGPGAFFNLSCRS